MKDERMPALRSLSAAMLLIALGVFAHGCHGEQDDLDIRQRFLVFAVLLGAGAVLLLVERCLSRTGQTTPISPFGAEEGSCPDSAAVLTGRVGRAAHAGRAVQRSRAA